MSWLPLTRTTASKDPKGALETTCGYYNAVAGLALALALLLGSVGCALSGNSQGLPNGFPNSMGQPRASIIQKVPLEGVRIVVSPNIVTLAPGATQLFSASVINMAETEVVWTASAGTISPQGSFTAPNVTKSTTVTITATSKGYVVIKAYATVTVMPGSSSLAITTTSLSPVSSGAPYSTSISAAGGNTPYQWSLTSGSLPSGLVLDATSGLISGTTTQTGSFSFTIKVSDASAHSASQNLVVQVNPPTQNSGYDGPAELPRIYMQTAMADTPSPGTTVTVNAGGDLQSALNAANCGDVVELAAGATFNGNFTLPAKSCDDAHWITVRTSAPDASLPAEGTRITPCYAGVSSLHGLSLNCASTNKVMAKIVGFPPIETAAGSSYYRLIGLELTQISGQFVYSIMNISDTSDYIVVDRCWVHGTATDNSQQGVRFNSSYLALVDSFVSDIHYVETDSQAVGGAAGTGPYKIVNNYLEAAGENIMFGGSAATTTPGDIEIRFNHIYKPLTWMPGNSTYAGIKWTVKDLFELKNGQRLLLEGNIFENMWGTPIVITPKNQNNQCPICIASNITFRYNIVRHGAVALSIADAPSDAGGLAQSSQFISIHDDLFDDINRVEWDTGASSWMFYFGACPSCQPVHDVTMTHLTVVSTNSSFLFFGNSASNPVTNLSYTENIQQYGLYGVDGCGTSTLATCAPGAIFTGNAIVGGSSTSFPDGNSFPASWTSLKFVNFNNGDNGNYQLAAGSPFLYATPPPGANINTVNTMTAGVSQW
jgi:putative Ig domain-containing protein